MSGASSNKQEIPAPAQTVRAVRILVVDDRKESVELVAAILLRHIAGAEILKAFSGEACLEIAAREDLDVIVLDARMPGLDGFETCRRLKRAERTERVPVLMISGVLTRSRDRATGMDCGADGYICKPFENLEFVAQVNVLLRMKRSEDELRANERQLRTDLAARGEALAASESRFRVLLEYSPDALFVEDEHGVVLDVNQAACLLHGVPREELIGRNVLDLVPAEQRDTVRRQYPGWFSGELHALESVSYTMDGRCVPVEIRASQVDYAGRRAVILHVRDISTRKKADEALRLSEARYRAIVEDQTDMVCRALPDTVLTFVNKAVERYFGMSRQELVGRPYLDFVPGDDRLAVQTWLQTLRPDNAVITLEHRIRLPDGRVRWQQWVNRGMFDGDGRLVEVQSVGRDITERLEIENRQQTILRGMRAIVEIADELIATTDEDMLLRRAVELARSKLGLERVGILLNRDPWVQGTFGTDFSGCTTDERVKRIPMDGAWREVMRLRGPDEPRWRVTHGPHVYWEGQRPAGGSGEWVVLTPIQTAHKSIGVFCNDAAISHTAIDESLQEVVAVYCSLLANIAERKAVEAERGRLALAVDQSAESVVITDTRGLIQYANPGFERMSGYKREEVIGKTPRLLKSGKHSDAFYRRMWTTLQRGQVWTGRMTNRRMDGTFYEVEHTISPVRDSRGQIISYLSVSQDVTAAVQMEAELRQAQKMESIGRLAGGIAHDFNNLLTAILGFARMVASELRPDSGARADVEEIISAGERASRLTKQLLSFGRKQVVQVQSVDLNVLVSSMENMLRRTLGEHIELATRLTAELGLIEADPGQVEQVVMNLAINAGDAMPRGGRLELVTGVTELDEEYCAKYVNLKPGPFVFLTVRDNGCGMPDHVRERAFEPFFTTKEKGKGSGLGLATVYGIVRQCHGHIELTSEINMGTVITIYFPKATGEMPLAPAESKVVLQGGTETILVVEDEPIVRRLAIRNLQSLGYRIIEARHGGEAYELYINRKEPIDLVLTDVIMPKLNGPELIEKLRATEPGLRFVFMSGFAEDMLNRPAQPDGQAALVTKPFTRETLAHHVRLALDRSPAKTPPRDAAAP